MKSSNLILILLFAILLMSTSCGSGKRASRAQRKTEQLVSREQKRMKSDYMKALKRMDKRSDNATVSRRKKAKKHEKDWWKENRKRNGRSSFFLFRWFQPKQRGVKCS